MTSSEFQDTFDAQSLTGRSLLYVNSYNNPNGSSRFSGVWVDNAPYNDSITHHVELGDSLQDHFNTYTSQGFTTDVISGYRIGGQHRYVGQFIK